jgi:hypothetical protein
MMWSPGHLHADTSWRQFLRMLAIDFFHASTAR